MELVVNRDLKEPKEGDIAALPRGQRTRATLMARKPKVRPLACGIEVEMGAWQTGATMEEIRTTIKPEGRTRLMEPEEWRVEVHPETRKSVAKAERRLTETKPNG